MNEYFSSITYLMPQLKVGDKDAWNNLCDKFSIGLQHRANRFIRDARLTSSVNADDLVQESLLKAWKRVERFQGATTAQFAAWLFAIVRNTFLDWCKSPGKKTTLSASLSWFDFEDGIESPSEVAICSELEARLYACLAEIEPVSQKVIMLRHFDALKFVEIAKKVTLNPNTTASLYRRGIEELKNLMEEDEG